MICTIHLPKIDVEGMEKFVIQGAKQLLKDKKIDNILIEICPENLAMAGYDIQCLHEIFTKLGYVPYSVGSDGKKEYQLTLADLQALTLANVLLIPQ
jgi:hypothetical protein